MKIATTVCFTLFLVGCVNTSSPEFIAKSEKTCAGYGFKPGSDQMANCKMNLAIVQEQDNMRRKQNVARAFSDMGNDMQRQADRTAYIQAHNRPINCTSYRYGNMVNTSCQ